MWPIMSCLIIRFNPFELADYMSRVSTSLLPECVTKQVGSGGTN